MTNESDTDYVHIAARGPRVMRDWLNRRAKFEVTDASTIIRRLLRNYIRQVDAKGWDEMAAVLVDDEKGEADGERK